MCHTTCLPALIGALAYDWRNQKLQDAGAWEEAAELLRSLAERYRNSTFEYDKLVRALERETRLYSMVRCAIIVRQVAATSHHAGLVACL